MAHISNLNTLQLKKLERSLEWLREVLADVKAKPLTSQTMQQVRLLETSISNISTVLGNKIN